MSKSFTRCWLSRRGFSAKITVTLLFVVPLVSNAFWGTLVGGTGANIPNRAVVLLVTLISLASIHKLLFYYTRRLSQLDLLVGAYCGLVLLEVGTNFSVEQVSGPFRMVLCFYGAAYFLRRGGSILPAAHVAVVGFGVALMWLFVTLPSNYGGGRLAYIGTPNTSARDLLGMFSILYLIVINRGIFGETLRWIARLEIAAVLVLMLLTGSRQGIILGVGVVWLGTKLFKEGVNLRVLFRRSFKVLGGILILGVGLYVLYLTTELGFIRRMFKVSLEGNLDRVVRYLVYYEYLTENFNSMLIGGVDIGEMFQRDGEAMRVAGQKIAAPHNAFLEVGLVRGLIPLAFYAIFHFILILKVTRTHNRFTGSRTSGAAVSLILSAFLIGMVTNYFTQASSCLSYLFYSISGFYTNIERDLVN